MRKLVSRLELFMEQSEDSIDYKKIDLVKEYTRLNRELFDGKLGIYPMKWNKRKTSGGFVQATRTKGGVVTITSIQFSTFFASTYRSFLNRLAHELIHVYLLEQNDAFAVKDSQKHGMLFKNEMRRINGLGKGYNIVVSEDRSNEVVNRTGKKKRYGVLLFKGINDGVVVVGEKLMEKLFDTLLTFPAEWLETKKMWFYYSMESFLARYPIKRKIGRRFGTYDMKPDEWKMVEKGTFYGSIINGEATR